MGYLERTGTKPGMAVWKFIHDDKVVYRNSNDDALRYFWQVRDKKETAVYSRVKTGGWKYGFTSQSRAKCGCGRRYDDNPSKEDFRHQSPGKWNKTIADTLKIMQQPVLCMVCYYENEYKAGRFCPLHVKQQLGLDR